MPRGRKGPPQESIDSILLAISRRDDIQPTTLAHYFDRLDEEWYSGAREKVLHLLRTGDASAHAAAVLILSELASEDDLEGLEDFVTDPTVSDMAKLVLAPILKELGSELADDGLVEYLNDPNTAMQQMQQRMLDLVGHSEMGTESILEDVIAMPMEKRLGFIEWLGQSRDPRAANLLVPLLENQSGKVVVAIIDALEQLGAVAAQQAIPALNYISTTSSNREIKQQARAALGRLMMLSSPGVEDAAIHAVGSQLLPPYEARASYIDGSGAQLLILSWQRQDGFLKGINVLYQDQWGIKDCYGIDEMDGQRWKEFVSELNQQGFGSFQAPFDFARALIIEARALNRRTRHKLPIAYSIWRPLIEGDASAEEKASPMQTILEIPELDEETRSLVEQSHELYRLGEFSSWLYEPLSRLEPYIKRYMVASSRSLHASSKRDRSRKTRQQEQRASIEELVDEAIHELIDDSWRNLYELRLRRQGALFKISEREHFARLAGAAAAALRPNSPIPIEEQPFPRALLSLSIEQGPLRLLTEAISVRGIGEIPLRTFKPEQ